MKPNKNYLEERRNNKKYWAKRAIEKTERFIEEAEKVATELETGYLESAKIISQEIKRIFSAFENAFDLSQAEAKRLIAKTGNKKPSKAIMQILNSITDPDMKRMLEAEISAPAYKYRLDRLDKLDKQAKELCKGLYGLEYRTDSAFLASEMEKTYNYTMFDLQQGTGISGAFDVLPKSKIEQVLKTNWRGKHFSSRIWGNTQQLADELRQSMIQSFITGESSRKAAVRIQERFNVGAYEARRLIRTEHTYVCGQAELEAYKASGVDKYEYASLIDDRTSLICERLDGKIYEVAKAKPGVNYPPMHPFCRSSTMAVLPSEEELNKEWDTFVADNVPQDMTFDEWLDKLEPTEDGKLVFKQKTVDKSAESGISETAKSAFVPAKNIKEAQEYAEKLGVKYADYSKFPLERANNMNMALSTLPDDATPLMVTDLQKFSKVTGTPLGRAQKNGYAVTASPYEINPSAVGSADSRLEGSGETIIAVNTRNFKTLDSLTESKREYNEKYENLKGYRWHFNMEGKMTDFHECGHAYEKKYGLPTGFRADAERWQKETKLGLLKSDREAWAEAYGAYYTHRDDLPDYIRRYFDEGETKIVSGSKVLSFEEWQKKIGVSIDKSAYC